ncbi:MAG TPA: hypothetical protein VLT33_40230, partial [Labilithrix sp.]|nr:hypothetical protein [Labilithrix sp.]
MVRRPPLVALSLSFATASALTAAGAAHAEEREAPRTAVAQQALALGTALGVRAVREDSIVPRASTGPSLHVLGRFLGTYRSVVVDAGLRFGFAALFDRDGHPAAAISHGLRLAALPIVKSDADRWSLAVGPTLVWSTDAVWFAKWDDAHAYWLGRRWLGPGARAWRSLSSGWRMDLSGELSLVGLESRPPAYRTNKQDALTHLSYYFADVNRSAEAGWLLDWQAVRVALDLHRSRGDRGTTVPSGFGLGVEARFDHTERPAAAYLFETTL